MKRFFKKLLILSAVFLPVSFVAVSCSEDAPNYAYSTKDLEGKWTWNTDQSTGEFSGTFDVKISKISDTKISISNFHNQSASMEAEVSGTTLTFGGDLNSQFEVKNGTGTISNGYQTIKIKYEILDKDEEESETVEASLSSGVISKKSVAGN